MFAELIALLPPEIRPVAAPSAFALIILLFLVILILMFRQKTSAAARDASAREELARLGERTQRLEAIEDELDAKSGRLAELSGECAAIRATLTERDAEAERLQNELAAARADREEARRLLGEAKIALSEQRSRAEEERKAAAEKLALLQEARVQLADQFKALAADILEEKSKSFSEVNRTSLGALLDPLKTQLADFKGKVEEVYVNEAKERSALGAQVRELMNLNHQLSKEANNLTTALRGQAKAQGNWGELILERVLEAAGLRKGVHYVPQESHARDDGSRVQPDVVINLPGDRFMVVDSKVSLVAYDDYVNSEDEAAKAAALRRHLDSVRAHIKELAAKNYQEIHGLKSLDFVILFVPIEPAFLVAVDRDPELWQAAWDKNILLVSPSQLMFVVRTVAQLWQKEELTKNAQDIASRGAALYDKLCGFVDDLDRVGKGLKDAQSAYERAYSRFSTGSGNVIRQAEMLRALGLKTRSQLDRKLVENAMDAEEAAALPAPEESPSEG